MLLSQDQQTKNHVLVTPLTFPEKVLKFFTQNLFELNVYRITNHCLYLASQYCPFYLNIGKFHKIIADSLDSCGGILWLVYVNVGNFIARTCV